ncbi:HAD family hydrolase [Maridesulfovibrio sp. FT414]|uniref:HAD family hydrolase n=1 Tax=Maridesulfovibrio sp. FT414 TaxID=2979469 RepID=UPI003D801973
MNKPINFTAAIFDLDGTLLNTLGEIATACNSALSRRGYPEHPQEAYRRFVGSGAKVLALRVLPDEKRNPQEQEILFNFIVEEFARFQNSIARPYDGAMDMLSAYTMAGKKIAVLSNKPEQFTIEAVSQLLPGADFFKVCGGRQDIPLKPEPDYALKLAADMGIAPKEIIFVGDSDIDMKTACNAGMFPVGAAWGFRGAEELREAGAKLVLDSPVELMGLL